MIFKDCDCMSTASVLSFWSRVRTFLPIFRNSLAADKLMSVFVSLFAEQHQYQVTPCANVSACASHFCRDHTAAVQIVCIKR